VEEREREAVEGRIDRETGIYRTFLHLGEMYDVFSLIPRDLGTKPGMEMSCSKNP
jgi:hypothetical protein